MASAAKSLLTIDADFDLSRRRDPLDEDRMILGVNGRVTLRHRDGRVTELPDGSARRSVALDDLVVVGNEAEYISGLIAEGVYNSLMNWGAEVRERNLNDAE